MGTPGQSTMPLKKIIKDGTLWTLMCIQMTWGSQENSHSHLKVRSGAWYSICQKISRWCWHFLTSKELTEGRPRLKTCLYLSVLFFSKFMCIKFTYICKIVFILYLNNVNPKIALLIILNVCIKFSTLG